MTAHLQTSGRTGGQAGRWPDWHEVLGLGPDASLGFAEEQAGLLLRLFDHPGPYQSAGLAHIVQGALAERRLLEALKTTTTLHRAANVRSGRPRLRLVGGTAVTP